MLTPIKIDNRMNCFLGTPAGAGKKPVVIHLHERYGIVEHTTDLGQKFVDAGYVTIVPDFFSRFTGDREALARGDDRCDLSDEQVLVDLDAVVAYLHALPEADMTKIAMSGVCQTGRQPVLLAARRNDIAGAVVLYGAIGGREWQGNELRPTPIEDLIAQVNCPVLGIFGEADHIISVDDVVRFRNCLEKTKKNCHIRIYAGAPHGWLNDTMPGRYRKEAAKDAWNLIISFLKKCFGDVWDKDRITCTYQSDYSAHYDFSKNVRME